MKYPGWPHHIYLPVQPWKKRQINIVFLRVTRLDVYCDLLVGTVLRGVEPHVMALENANLAGDGILPLREHVKRMAAIHS